MSITEIKIKTGIGIRIVLILISLNMIFAGILNADAAAAPRIAADFYGSIAMDGNPAIVGTDVAVFSGGKMCGRYVTRMAGRYGLMSCDSDSLKDVYFEINGAKAKADFVTKNNVNLSIDSSPYRIPEGYEIFLLAISLIVIAYLILRERKRSVK